MSDYFDNSAELVLKPFKKPIADIMNELKDDSNNFIAEMKIDPTGYLMSKLYPNQHIAASPKISSSNRFLFSILGNDGFRGWLKDYNDEYLKNAKTKGFAEFDPQQIRKDFALGLKEHADESIMRALLAATESGPIDIFDEYATGDRHPSAMAVVGPVAVAVAVAAVVVVAVMYVARTAPGEEFAAGTMESFAYSGPELVGFADEMIQMAQELKEKGKL